MVYLPGRSGRFRVRFPAGPLMVQKIGDFDEFLKKIDQRRKYVKTEYQAYGLELAKELGDWKNRSLYIKLAKELPRKILEQARLFVKDQPCDKIKNRARLFMWKLQELKRDAQVRK